MTFYCDYISKEQLEKELAIGTSHARICEKYHISSPTLSARKKLWGLQNKAESYVMRKGPSREQLQKLRNKHSSKEVCEILGITRDQLAYKVRKFKLPKKKVPGHCRSKVSEIDDAELIQAIMTLGYRGTAEFYGLQYNGLVRYLKNRGVHRFPEIVYEKRNR